MEQKGWAASADEVPEMSDATLMASSEGSNEENRIVKWLQ